MRVRFTKIALREVDQAARFYESRSEGLGEQFYERVDEAVEKIRRFPEGYQKVVKNLRRVNLEQFTDFALWYRIIRDGSLVVACLSSRRDPRLMQERASGVLPFLEP